MGQSYLSVWYEVLRQPYNGVCGHRELRSVGHNTDRASPGGRRWGNRVDGMPLGSALKNQHTPNQSLNHGCLHLKHVSEERCARYYALIVLLWLVYLSAARACLCRRGVVARSKPASIQGEARNNQCQNSAFHEPHAATLELFHPKPYLP